MRKIKIKEIVCIIGLLGTLTAHSQNTVWQIGNKDKSAKEFKFYKNDYRNYINDVYLYEVGRNHSADFPYFLPGPSDAWAGCYWLFIGRSSFSDNPNTTTTSICRNSSFLTSPTGGEAQQLREIHPNTQRHKP